MGWKKVTLRFEQIAEGKALQDAFETIFIHVGAPKDAAMFTNHDLDGDYSDYYFSPGAAVICEILMVQWKAADCAPPPLERTALLVGHAGALGMLRSAGSS